MERLFHYCSVHLSSHVCREVLQRKLYVITLQSPRELYSPRMCQTLSWKVMTRTVVCHVAYGRTLSSYLAGSWHSLGTPTRPATTEADISLQNISASVSKVYPAISTQYARIISCTEFKKIAIESAPKAVMAIDFRSFRREIYTISTCLLTLFHLK